MKSDTPTIIVGAIILVVMALSIVLITDRPAAKTEVRDTHYEIKQPGRGAAGGVKAAYDSTNEAARQARL